MNFFFEWFLIPFRHATLFLGFVRQEIRGRYAGSLGGLLWSVLTPLCNMLIYIFVFSVVLKMRLRVAETGTDSFVVYLMAGLLPWMAFSEAMQAAGGTFVSRADLITKVSFPIQLLPLTNVTVTFLLNTLGLLIFIGYLVLAGKGGLGWLWLPLVIAIHFFFTLGLVILTASLAVFIRDISQMMGLLISLWLYLTPILYPMSMVPERYRWLLYCNPMYPFIELYHQVLLRQCFVPLLACYALFMAFISLIAGACFFSRARRAFADVL